MFLLSIGCGVMFVNIRYFTEIMITVDNDVFGASDILKNTHLHTTLSIVLNILIKITIMRQVALF